MGCLSNSNYQPPPSLFTWADDLLIHGNIIDNSSRTIIGVCNICNVPINLNSIDYLNDQKLHRFKAINPSGHIPMLQEGDMKLVGSQHFLLTYLCKSKLSFDQVYPLARE